MIAQHLCAAIFCGAWCIAAYGGLHLPLGELFVGGVASYVVMWGLAGLIEGGFRTHEWFIWWRIEREARRRRPR